MLKLPVQYILYYIQNYIVNQKVGTLSSCCVSEPSHNISFSHLLKYLFYTSILREHYSLTLNEEVDVAEYPLAPETRDTMEPWRRKLDSDP